ncbi:MAG TPA: rod shape-determining protein MreC [Thermodesulfobacteriota bacterium]|nr:rod shape-determining protein MreC [Thermodesulfobacteriota bacterium]
MRIRDFFLSRRYSLFIFITLLLLFALVLMSLRAKQRKGVELFDALLMEICSPLQEGSTHILKTVQGTFQKYVFLMNLEKENRMLRQRIAELQEENNRARETKLAMDRLKHLLQFRQENSLTMIGAEVIGQDPSSWFKSVTIDKGERDGVKKGMAVISAAGVIGQILKTAPHYATVLLITDYNSAVDSIVQRTRAKAIVEGNGENRCQLKYLLRTEEVAVGDAIVTSGLAGNFPKGLMVGEIKRVDKKGHGVFQYAELVPSVDLTKLEEVFVVMEPIPPPPPPKEEKTKKVKKIKK